MNIQTQSNGQTETNDMFQQVTDRIIKALEEGVAPWKKPWKSDGVSCFPVNAITGRRYSGINVILLWMASEERGFTSNRWLTFRQALNAGGNVIKGEKGTFATRYRPYDRVKTDDDGNTVYDDNGQEVIESVYHASKCILFNVDQCENLPDAVIQMDQVTEVPEFERIAKIGQLIDASGVKINHRRQNLAYYYPITDSITLPQPKQFKSMQDYYSTLLHELVHSTGHAKRLNREGIISTKAKFGCDIYAFEELIAEIGSAFLCAEFGIDGNVQHESYIASWIKQLKEDKGAIFKAARFAREAFEFLMSLEQLSVAA